MFQSLLSWISPIGQDVSEWWRHRNLVSILVVVDLAHRRGEVAMTSAKTAVFQSLLSWISPIGGRYERQRGDGFIVSILVVVDLAHRPSVETW